MPAKYIQQQDNIYIQSKPKVILLPSSITNHLKRSKLSLLDLTNPAKLSQYMSKQDIRTLSVFSMYEFDQHVRKTISSVVMSTSYISLDNVFSTYSFINQANDFEDIDAIHQAALRSSENKPYIPELILLDDEEFNKEKQYYNIQISDSDFILINIEQGFLNCLEDSELLFNFTRDLLKSLYAFLPIYNVSGESIFSLYLALLRQNSA